MSHFTRSLGSVGLLLAVGCRFWEKPGQGAKAERGYARAGPVLTALQQYRAAAGMYPDSLEQLVPAHLPAAALAAPTRVGEQYPLEYFARGSTCELRFRYTGPGMNTCTYTSTAAAWECYGNF